MKIAICASMAFAREMMETKQALKTLGHAGLISDFAGDFLGKNEKEKQRLNKRNILEKDAIREFWKKIKTCDAIFGPQLRSSRH